MRKCRVKYWSTISHKLLGKRMSLEAFGAVRCISIHHQTLHSLQFMVTRFAFSFMQDDLAFFAIPSHYETVFEKFIGKFKVVQWQHPTICDKLCQLLNRNLLQALKIPKLVVWFQKILKIANKKDTKLWNFWVGKYYLLEWNGWCTSFQLPPERLARNSRCSFEDYKWLRILYRQNLNCITGCTANTYTVRH